MAENGPSKKAHEEVYDFWLLTCLGGKDPLHCEDFKVALYCLRYEKYSRRLLGGEKC